MAGSEDKFVSGIDGRRLLRSSAIGIAAGLSASWIMERFQAAASSTSGSARDKEAEPATVKAADAVTRTATGKPIPNQYKAPAGSAVHYGFGAVLGGLYGALGEFLPAIRAGFGTAYGAGVAVVADEALVPTLGLAPEPQDVPAQTHAYGIVSHLLFGAALEGSRRLLEEAVALQAEPKDEGEPG